MTERVEDREGLIRSFLNEAFPVPPPSEIAGGNVDCFFGFPLSREEAEELLQLPQGVPLRKDERVRAWRLPFKDSYLVRADIGGCSSVGVYREEEGILQLIVKIVFKRSRLRLPPWRAVGLIYRTPHGYYLKWNLEREENGRLRGVGKEGEIMISREDDTTPPLEEVKQEIEKYGLEGEMICKFGPGGTDGGLFFKSSRKVQGDVLNNLFFKIFLGLTRQSSPLTNP